MLTSHTAGNEFLQIVSAMITPAILVLASGSLISATLLRLARITDRARELIDQIEGDLAAGNMLVAESRRRWLHQLRRRSAFAERGLQAFYVAVGCFIAASLSIAVDNLTRDTVPWLGLVLVVVGACFLFLGTAALIVETGIATGSLRTEISDSERLMRERES